MVTEPIPYDDGEEVEMKARRFVKLSIATARALKRMDKLKEAAAAEAEAEERQRLEVELLVRKFQGRRDSRR
jgi:hypothetical protein